MPDNRPKPSRGPWFVDPDSRHPWIVKANTEGPHPQPVELFRMSYRPNAVLCATAPKLVDFAAKIAALSPYGDGEDELADNEDAALVLNALRTEAAALVKEAGL